MEKEIQPNGLWLQGEKIEFCGKLFQKISSDKQYEKLMPRSLFIDFQPDEINEIQNSEYRGLFHPDNFIVDKQDSSKTFAKGFYKQEGEIIEKGMDRIRKFTINCSDLQGFFVFHSVGGGTGSGFGSLLLEQISINYPKKPVIGFSIFPSRIQSQNTYEPYNYMLTMNSLLEHTDVCAVLDNQAIFDTSKLLKFKQVNSLSHIIIYFSYTNGRKSFYKKIDDFQRKLVPYLPTHLLLCSYTPFITIDKSKIEQLHTAELSNAIFEPSNMLALCDPRYGKYMACSVFFRGDLSMNEIGGATSTLQQKKTIQFVDCCPRSVTFCLNKVIPCIFPNGELGKQRKSAFMIANSTSIQQVFSQLNNQFDEMFSKKCLCFRRNRRGIISIFQRKTQIFRIRLQRN
ncbi:unnamed protein product [Paramecium primaurelia]|uniref:Tubulin alpha chain n=1 Tax=Paramecium primaurelia TaxID=5886 RepID=A0A8S1QKA4_PARPR|nr:unnamed protein product [Paramecium primaurelia]